MFRQKATSGWVGSGAAITATFAVAPLAGNTILAFLFTEDGADATVTGYTALVSQSVDGTQTLTALYKVAGAAEGLTVTAPVTSGSTARALHIYEYAGVVSSTGQSYAADTSTALPGSAVAGATKGVLVVAIYTRTDSYGGDLTITPLGTLSAVLGTERNSPGRGHAWSGTMLDTTTATPRATRTAPGNPFGSAMVEVLVTDYSPESPRGLSGAPEYVVELYDSGATFGPNNKIGEIWDARNVGWSRYDRLAGKAFFTLPQTSTTLALISPPLTHVAITRVTPSGDTLVYRGFTSDFDSTGDDVVVDCYDYQSLLSLSRAGFKTLYPTKKLGSEIVSPEWVLARTAGSSPLGFVATGTIQDPLGTDAVTIIKTNAQFGTMDQSRMQLFYDLTEMGRANTANQVTFEIDLTNTFNFWKNKGSASGYALVLGGNVTDYQYQPGWSRYRNDIATIGTSSAGGPSEIVSTSATEIAAKGLRQDVATLKTLAGIAGGATEADQQKAALDRMLKKLYQQQSGLAVRAERGRVEPFVGYSLNDTLTVEIANGNDSITGQRRLIGLRCVFAEAGEDVDLVLAQVAT